MYVHMYYLFTNHLSTYLSSIHPYLPSTYLSVMLTSLVLVFKKNLIVEIQYVERLQRDV